MAVGVSHELIGFLRGGIETNWMIHVVTYAEWHSGVRTIYTGTAGIHQVLHATITAAFQYIQKTHDIAVDIGMGVRQRIAYATLRGEVDNAPEAPVAEQTLHAESVSHVQLDEAEIRKRGKLLKAIFFQVHVIVIIKIVYADHLNALLQQAASDVHTDKATDTRN